MLHRMAANPNAHPRHVCFERERGVYDVDVAANVAYVSATVGNEAGRSERTLALFAALGKAGIPVFLIKLHGQVVTFSVEESKVECTERVLTDAGFPFHIRRDLAIVTVLAGTMRDLIGIMVRIADALQLAQARMYGVGDSHSSVQCLIDGYRAEAAVRQLRTAFGLEVTDD